MLSYDFVDGNKYFVCISKNFREFEHLLKKKPSPLRKRKGKQGKNCDRKESKKNDRKKRKHSKDYRIIPDKRPGRF